MRFQQFFVLFILFSFAFYACSRDNNEENNPTPSGNNNVGTDSTAVASDTTGLLTQSKATDASGNVYTIGFDQVSSNNQDAFIRKTDNSGSELWKVVYESTPVDGRGVNIFVDASNNVWASFSVDGGSNNNNYINKKEIETDAFSGVFARSYGSGGGPKVAVLARINPDNGKIIKGTFLTARLNSGKTNTSRIEKLGAKNGNVAVYVETSAWPPAKGSSYKRFPNITDGDRTDGSFSMYYEVETDMSEIVVAKIFKP